MNISLYKATQLARLESHVDTETGEVNIEAWLQAKDVDLPDKQRAVVAYIKNRQVIINAMKAHEAEIANKRHAIEAQNDNLSRYLAENMKSSQTSVIEATDGLFKATLYVNRDESVEWLDGVDIPKYLGTEKTVFTPSKTLAKEAIERGEPIACARIVRKDRLTIK
jgi:Siphovirus Gp157